MKSDYNLDARKRPVNLTVNADLLDQARAMTGNLSNTVETLLADFVRQEHSRQAQKIKAMQAALAAWNEFNAKRGSFADEHSTL